MIVDREGNALEVKGAVELTPERIRRMQDFLILSVLGQGYGSRSAEKILNCGSDTTIRRRYNAIPERVKAHYRSLGTLADAWRDRG
jgi:hypothetical protein